MNRRSIPGAVALTAVTLLAACEHQPSPPIAMPPQQVEVRPKPAPSK